MRTDPEKIKNDLEMYIIDVAHNHGPKSGIIAVSAAIELLAEAIERMTVIFDEKESNSKAFYMSVVNKLRNVKEEI